MSEGNNQVDPTRLSIEQAAKLLSAAYRERIDAENIRADIDSGAPTNIDLSDGLDESEIQIIRNALLKKQTADKEAAVKAKLADVVKS